MRDGPGDVVAGRVIALFSRIYIYIYILMCHVCHGTVCGFLSGGRHPPGE